MLFAPSHSVANADSHLDGGQLCPYHLSLRLSIPCCPFRQQCDHASSVSQERLYGALFATIDLTRTNLLTA